MSEEEEEAAEEEDGLRLLLLPLLSLLSLLLLLLLVLLLLLLPDDDDEDDDGDGLPKCLITGSGATGFTGNDLATGNGFAAGTTVGEAIAVPGVGVDWTNPSPSTTSQIRTAVPLLPPLST